MGSSPNGPTMNKIEKAKRREAARVLLIQAHDMIDVAKDKMLEIDGSDDKVRTLWKMVSVALLDLSCYNTQKDLKNELA